MKNRFLRFFIKKLKKYKYQILLSDFLFVKLDYLANIKLIAFIKVLCYNREQF